MFDLYIYIGKQLYNFNFILEKIKKITVKQDGRFHNEPKEAESASKLTSVMIILVCIFIGLILILDLSTINRDIKRIKSNLELQEKRIQYFRNKNLFKEETDEI